MKELRRNVVVARLGTPDQTEGNVNDPREREEDGISFNERWIYLHLIDDPSGMPQRVIYWHRYDFVAAGVRRDSNDQWQPDSTLVAELSGLNSRLEQIDPENNPPIVPRSIYRAVSDFPGKADLGGYIQRVEVLREMGEQPSVADSPSPRQLPRK